MIAEPHSIGPRLGALLHGSVGAAKILCLFAALAPIVAQSHGHVRQTTCRRPQRRRHREHADGGRAVVTSRVVRRNLASRHSNHGVRSRGGAQLCWPTRSRRPPQPRRLRSRSSSRRTRARTTCRPGSACSSARAAAARRSEVVVAHGSARSLNASASIAPPSIAAPARAPPRLGSATSTRRAQRAHVRGRALWRRRRAANRWSSTSTTTCCRRRSCSPRSPREWRPTLAAAAAPTPRPPPPPSTARRCASAARTGTPTGQRGDAPGRRRRARGGGGGGGGAAVTHAVLTNLAATSRSLCAAFAAAFDDRYAPLHRAHPRQRRGPRVQRFCAPRRRRRRPRRAARRRPARRRRRRRRDARRRPDERRRLLREGRPLQAARAHLPLPRRGPRRRRARRPRQASEADAICDVGEKCR